MIIVLSYVYLQNSIVAAFQHNPSWYPCQSTLNEKWKCKCHWCWEQSWKDDQKRTDRWHQITFELVCFRHSFGIVVGLLLYYIKRLECNILIYLTIFSNVLRMIISYPATKCLKPFFSFASGAYKQGNWDIPRKQVESQQLSDSFPRCCKMWCNWDSKLGVQTPLDAKQFQSILVLLYLVQ